MFSIYGEVISVRGVFVQEKHGSKKSAWAPELSASDALSSPIIGMTADDIERLFIRPSGEPGVVDQSVSNPYDAECSPSIFIDCVVQAAIVDVIESSGIDISFDVEDWLALLPPDFGLPAREDGL
jgi:hypothetical protein